MIASVLLTAQQVLTVRGVDHDPFLTVTIGEWSIDLTRNEARQAADALRAAAMSDIDDLFT